VESGFFQNRGDSSYFEAWWDDARRQGGVDCCSDEGRESRKAGLNKAGGDGVQVAVFIHVRRSERSVGETGENWDRGWRDKGWQVA